MDMKILGFITIILLVWAGCFDQSGTCDMECDDGYYQTDDCQCLPIGLDNQSMEFELSEGDNFIMNDYNITVKRLSVLSNPVNNTCELDEVKIGIEYIYENETIEDYIILGANTSYVLPDNSTLSISDILYNVSLQNISCEMTDPYVKIKFFEDSSSADELELEEGDVHDFEDGTYLKIKSITQSVTVIDDELETYSNWEENDDAELGDIEIELDEINVNMERDVSSSTTITREEGQQASLPNDYSLRVNSITQSIATPSTVDNEFNLVIGDGITLQDGTLIRLESFSEDVLPCNESCGVENETVTLDVRLPSDSFEEYILEQGETVELSERVTIRAADIDQDSNCQDDVCVISGRMLVLETETSTDFCTISNELTSITITNQDLEETIVNLAVGDVLELTSEVNVELVSIAIEISDPVDGVCTVESEEVTIDISLPSLTCSLDGGSAEFTVNIDGDDKDFEMELGDTETIDGVSITLDELDAEIELYDGECVYSDALIDFTVGIQEQCIIEDREVELEYGGPHIDKVTKIYDGSTEFFIGSNNVYLEKIEEDSELDDGDCEISNELVKFEINSPETTIVTLSEGDDYTAGSINVIVDTLNIEIIENEDGQCELVNKSVEVTASVSSEVKTKLLYEENDFLIGMGMINIEQISADHNDEVSQDCVVDPESVIIVWSSGEQN